jgi:ubiquinone/menaquinone biosynthesis C-methylase UbiE
MPVSDPYAEIAPFYDLEFDSFDADVDLYLGYASLVGGPILELGCGTGRLLAPLSETGLPVTGIDPSVAMLERARVRLQSIGGATGITLQQGDMRDLSAFPRSGFRLVIVAINSFLHLETVQDQIETLRQVLNVLDRDGLLVLDLFNPAPDTLARMDDRYTFDAHWATDSGSSVERYSYRQLDSASQIVTTTLFYDTISESGIVHRRTASYTMRYIHRFELELLLTLAGFEIEGIYGSYSLDALEHDSEHLIAVAHRTPDSGEQ